MENVVDLRKQPELPPPPKELPSPRRRDSIPDHTETLLRWTIAEYESQTPTRNWFIGTGALALLLAVVAILNQNYFFLAFVTLAFFVIIMYMKREPREIMFAVAKNGIYIGHTILPWGQLKSFWIFERSDIKELSLETDKTLTPFLHIPLADVDPEKIRELLKKFVKEKEHEMLLSDEFAKKLGF